MIEGKRECSETASVVGVQAIPKKPPIFIVGAQRSGTTMLRLMMNNHPNLAIAFEPDIIRTYRRVDSYGDLSDRSNQERLLHDYKNEHRTKEAEVVRDADAILAHPINDYGGFLQVVFEEYARAQSKQRWGVKAPSLVLSLDALWELFPGCQIIHIVRDGRDVALSLGRVSWGYSHIPRAAEDWKWKVVLGRKMGSMITDHYLEVRYEDLVLEPRKTLKAICVFLGEPFDDSMLRYHLDAESEMPEGSLQWHQTSVSPPDPGKVFEWKTRMSRSDRLIFDRIAGDTLELFGYDREASDPTWASWVKWLYYKVWKRW